jgi:hypothetical protein
VLGRELLDLFPIAFLPTNHALAVAIMSYNGRLEYGLLGDYDALPDIDVIAEGLDDALAELLDTARGRTSAGNGAQRAKGVQRNGGGPVSILPASRSRPQRGPAADMRAKRSPRRGSTPKRPQG